MKNFKFFIASLLLVATAFAVQSCTKNNIEPQRATSFEKGMYIPTQGGMVTFVDTINNGYWIAPVDEYYIANGGDTMIVDHYEAPFMTYQNTVNYVDTMTYGGFTDWSLPDTIVLNCINYPEPYINPTQGTEIWSKYTQRTIRTHDCTWFRFYTGTMPGQGLNFKTQFIPVRWVQL